MAHSLFDHFLSYFFILINKGLILVISNDFKLRISMLVSTLFKGEVEIRGINKNALLPNAETLLPRPESRSLERELQHIPDLQILFWKQAPYLHIYFFLHLGLCSPHISLMISSIPTMQALGICSMTKTGMSLMSQKTDSLSINIIIIEIHHDKGLYSVQKCMKTMPKGKIKLNKRSV